MHLKRPRESSTPRLYGCHIRYLEIDGLTWGITLVLEHIVFSWVHSSTNRLNGKPLYTCIELVAGKYL